MSDAAIDEFLGSCPTGGLATIDKNGYPYVTPMHFVYLRGNVYVHGRSHGEKLSNIRANSKVCFQADCPGGILPSAERVCGTNAIFKSVIIRGTAHIVDDNALKRTVLEAFVEKYTPEHKGAKFGEAAFAKTTIIEVRPCCTSGKQHPPMG